MLAATVCALHQVFGDRRDNPFDARKGWFGAFNAERVTEFESGADAIKLLTTAYGYRTYGRLTFASAARVGLSFLACQLIADAFGWRLAFIHR